MKTKTMNKILIAAAVVLALTACKPPEPIQTVEKTYEITQVKKPKHFRVHIRDVATGQDLGSHYVSKRCSSWDKLQIGSRWTFPETTYRKEDGSTYTSVSVSGLCNRLASVQPKAGT